jgi:RNA polymerase sigma factor (sigma-70 family)
MQAETRSSLIRRVHDTADASSWGEFVELYEPLLVSYVRSRGLGPDDARDVVQEIFVALVRSLPAFELDRARGRFRTWLWQVATNAVAAWAGRQRRRSNAEDGWCQRREALGPGGGRGPDAEWLDALRRRVLTFVLGRVRSQAQAKTWACFEQHVLLGRASAEVAAELGLTANAVYVNASRVLDKVRTQCADYMEELGDV